MPKTVTKKNRRVKDMSDAEIREAFDAVLGISQGTGIRPQGGLRDALKPELPPYEICISNSCKVEIREKENG